MNSSADHTQASEPTFARDLGLFDATMIGVGAMIGAGIFVLTGIAAGESGPASILAFALNGAVTLLTAFAYAELDVGWERALGTLRFARDQSPDDPQLAALYQDYIELATKDQEQGD